MITNISIAQYGLHTMAISACYGAPMLNLLLGIGLAGILKSIRNQGPVIFVPMGLPFWIVWVGLMMGIVGSAISYYMIGFRLGFWSGIVRIIWYLLVLSLAVCSVLF
ncbi:hypothetical protein HDV02_004252 [Globomyces sp. JEL0801]|nr:hypothetical protein HDV02_004252 [Globomyces sp. JEL0801]